MHTVEAWKRVADEYNTMGETLKREGLKLAFHSHTGEYVDVGSGKTGLDVFIANTKPTLLTSQMDLGWARVASQDPVAWSTKYPGPFRMWHVKDFENLKAAQDRETITLTNAAKEQPRSPVAPGNATTAARGARNAAGSPPAAPLSGRRCPVGEGDIDFKPMLAAWKDSGMQYFFIEQGGAGAWPGGSLACAATSYNNLRKMIG